MADNRNNMVRNIIDCVLVVLVIFFGYHYFAASDNAKSGKGTTVQVQDRFMENSDKNKKAEKKEFEIPKELFDIMGK